MKSGIIGTYFSTPNFYKKALRLALPICLQQALNQGASFLDTMMVSHVGGVGAVTVATQIDNLLMLVGFGVNSCILIFASQFFGAGNRRNLKRCFGLQLLLNVCIALAFFLLAKLGGTEWQRTRAKVKKATEEMAQELIELYARRRQAQGYAFPPDGDWQSDFETRFEYDETDDQLNATAEIKRDMEKTYPMDRLLCGDVGVGKTEVGRRAAL